MRGVFDREHKEGKRRGKGRQGMHEKTRALCTLDGGMFGATFVKSCRSYIKQIVIYSRLIASSLLFPCCSCF